MHGLFAGLMGIFAGFTTFFHGGHILPPSANQAQTVQQTNISGTPASPSGTMKNRFGREMKLPTGERPFFGTVTVVNGSTLTVQMSGMMMRHDDISPTPSTPKTITVLLDSSTQYTGGSQSDITTNTRIAGIGKTNSDGSITAIQVRINPTIPTGYPHRGGFMHPQRDQ